MSDKKFIEVTCDTCHASADFDRVDEAFGWLEDHLCMVDPEETDA